MTNTEFAVRNNITNDIVFFDSFIAARTSARVGKVPVSIFAYYDGGVRVRHTHEYKNGRGRRVNKVV